MTSIKPFRLRSFVRRGRRVTVAQKQAHDHFWSHFGLQLEEGLLDYQAVFGRDAPRFLEIGFGSGQSLLALAALNPDKDFIGVETHQPGIGSLLLGMQKRQLNNIRIYNADAVDVLEDCIPPSSLDGVQLFFPDPWPKRRHHPRRLIQAQFVSLVVEKLKVGGTLHLATDWEDYASHMLNTLLQEKRLINLSSSSGAAERSTYRPILTKFERRALRAGRLIRDLQFSKHLDNNHSVP